MKDILNAWLFGKGGALKVRAIIAYAVTGMTLAMWFREIPVSDAQLVLMSGIDTFYFATRAKEV